MAMVASETYTSTSAPIQYAAVTAFKGGPFMDEYLLQARKILKTILKYITVRFNELNITYPSPQGAFYLFPDFEFYRAKLLKMGIETSQELCDRILEETGVAMLPGSDFGRDPAEFSARIAYVDFNGRDAMSAYDQLLHEANSNDSFVKEYCPRITSAVERLGNWLLH